MPVLLALKLPGARSFTPFALIGPALSYELGCDVTVRAQEQSERLTCTDDGDQIELETTRTDVSAIFSGGAEVAAGPVSPTFELSYHLGLTDVAQDPSDGLKHRGVLLTAGS